MALYPSQAWCDAWKKALNSDKQVAETGKNWGVGWNGNVLFIITPGDGLEHEAYVNLDFAKGECLDARLLGSQSEVEPGFFITGAYADYKPVVKGQKDFLQGVVTGTFKIKGDMFKIMRNAKFIRAVANSISSFESEYLGD